MNLFHPRISATNILNQRWTEASVLWPKLFSLRHWLWSLKLLDKTFGLSFYPKPWLLLDKNFDLKDNFDLENSFF